MKFDEFLRIKPSYCQEQPHWIELKEDGSGVTELIQAYLTNSDLDMDLVEVHLMSDLYLRMGLKFIFERIKVQYSVKDHTSLPLWEIYLVEVGKRQKPLSSYPSEVHLAIAELAYRYLPIPKEE